MTFEIRIATSKDAEEWNAIISKSLQGTIFHQWDWMKITEMHTHTTMYPLIGIKDGTPIGVFPVFFQKKGPIRMVFSPPPHAALLYLGPVMVGYDTLNQETRENNYISFVSLVERFITSELKAQYIRISLPPGLQDPRPFKWSGYSVEPLYDYEIDLRIGLDSLLKTLDKRGRQNLTRAKKRGITVEEGGGKEYEKILNLMDIRYVQQGKKVMESKEYFLDIYDSYKNYLKIFVAKYEGEIVSGCIDFQYRDTYYSWIGNPRREKPISPSPNDLLIWESVRYAHEHGCRYYITMSAAGNKRLHSYYASKFNPELKARYVVTKKTLLAGLLERGYKKIR